MPTYEEQLEQVQTAIAAIEGGAQSWSISTSQSTRTYTRADLKTLYDRERFLELKIERRKRGGVRIQYGVPER